VVLAERPRVQGPEVRQGAYLTDGRQLVWVAGTFDGKVALEDCRYPLLPLRVLPVPDLLAKGWRRVVPLRTA
jgi:hypothetical protein